MDYLSFKKLFGMNVSANLLIILVFGTLFMKVCELLSWDLASCRDKTGKTAVKKNKTGKTPVKTK